MLPPLDELKSVIEAQLPGAALTVQGAALYADPKNLSAVCRFLRDHERFRMDYLSSVTVVDYPQEQRMDVVYHLYSMTHKHGPLTLKAKLPRAAPTIASVTPIWRSAEFREREAYDLYGVVFDGHPDLRRILLWDEFEGHPMRKDYVVEDQDAPEPSR